jgi:ribosomal protein S18 acetylase RimI-like enzyme
MRENSSREKIKHIEFIKHCPETIYSLANFFYCIVENGDDKYFHPHQFTCVESEKIANNFGLDVYYIAIDESDVLAYGMLRGWDDGYKIPSLGIIVHPDFRGFGIAQAMMYFLHAVARLRGAENIRLKVHKNNLAAQAMYYKMGYKIIGEEGDEFIELYAF